MHPDPETNPASLGVLAAALAKAQGAFPAIVRDKEVDTGTFKYKYAALDSVLAAVREPLATNGLAITQLLDGPDLVTMLIHESGAYLSGRVALPRGDTVQKFGSGVTYFRRYALQAILGVATEEDDDGKNAGGLDKPRARRPATAAENLTGREQTDDLPAFAPLAATHRDGLIGVAEKTKDAAEFAEMRQGPDGHVLAFRLVEGRRAVKIVAIGIMAELVYEHRAGIEGYRVTLWGTVEDEPPWTPAGATRPVVVQHVRLERLKVGPLDLSAPDVDEEAPDLVAAATELFPDAVVA